MMQMMGMMHELLHPSAMAMPHTMPMTHTMPMVAQNMPRMMQMMGMMLQMTGMMHELMGAAMPMTHTMPMGGGTHMGMMDMAPIMAMMEQMMSQMMPMTGTMPMEQGMQPGMMQMMGHMMQLMGMMQGTMPMATTSPVSGTSGAALPALTQTAPAGAVEIKVAATNLQDVEAETIDFAIELNSHSVEIDLDLAETARLLVGTDEMTPIAWEAANPKGHHVTGVLRFARADEDERAMLDEATEISLIIGGLPGNEEHTFTWQVNAQ
jgi:hypothetical protein